MPNETSRVGPRLASQGAAGWVTIEDAVARAGIDARSIRRLIFEQRIRARLKPGVGEPTYLVSLEDLTIDVRDGADRAAPPPRAPSRVRAANDELGALVERFRYLERSVLEQVRSWARIEGRLSEEVASLRDGVKTISERLDALEAAAPAQGERKKVRPKEEGG